MAPEREIIRKGGVAQPVFIYYLDRKALDIVCTKRHHNLSEHRAEYGRILCAEAPALVQLAGKRSGKNDLLCTAKDRYGYLAVSADRARLAARCRYAEADYPVRVFGRRRLRRYAAVFKAEGYSHKHSLALGQTASAVYRCRLLRHRRIDERADIDRLKALPHGFSAELSEPSRQLRHTAGVQREYLKAGMGRLDCQVQLQSGIACARRRGNNPVAPAVNDKVVQLAQRRISAAVTAKQKRRVQRVLSHYSRSRIFHHDIFLRVKTAGYLKIIGVDLQSGVFRLDHRRLCAG